MRNIFTYMKDLRTEEPLANYIQNPKITPFLSESLALHIIDRYFGFVDLRLGNRNEADIVAIDKDNSEVSIEVKGTGTSAWIGLTEKDYRADYLIWLLFEDYFENPDRETIKVFVVQPSKIPERRQRITLNALKQLVGDNMRSFQISLDKFLRGD